MSGTQLADDPGVRLARRYPPPRTPRKVTIGLIALGATLALAMVIWLGVDNASKPVEGRINTWTITSNTSAEFTLTVDRVDPARPAMCRVIAQADNFERVGELAVQVPPGDDRLTEVADQLKTFRRATSVSLDRCEALQ
ncbi:MAG: DUF4307 domain-containing protein [Propionibacteriales bacterium]|nr:DUF4307 domain-containing protein [Propionibacteriales bacterium]